MIDIKSTTPKPYVFVLMPFDTQFDDIYTFGIKGAADEVGAYAERIDEQIFSEGILDRIFNQISKADVIVADMTGRNPNVFYEVGYAHALGKIVLLLTQNVDDIPFDLKHRQHTVYSGKIELLRRELSTRLQWAIIESKKHGGAAATERFSLRLHNIDIPLIGSSSDIPEIHGTVDELAFGLPLYLRNDSLESSTPISYAYLFATKDSDLVPASAQQWTSLDANEVFITNSFSSRKSEIKPLDSFEANRIDAEDDLTQQFRLPFNILSIPPGAIESSLITFMFRREVSIAQSQFRLRLHSTAQYHEYRFKLIMHLDLQKVEEHRKSKNKDEKQVW